MVDINIFEYVIWLFTITSSFGLGVCLGYYQQWKALDYKR